MYGGCASEVFMCASWLIMIKMHCIDYSVLLIMIMYALSGCLYGSSQGFFFLCSDLLNCSNELQCNCLHYVSSLVIRPRSVESPPSTVAVV